MPSASQLYSTGKWLNAADLANNASIGLNKRIPAVVHHVEPEQIGQGADQKVMLMLELVSKQGQAWPKKLPLNKTNSMVMVASYGDDYSFWPGKEIQIWAENVMFSGKMVPGIKLAAVSNGAASAQAIPGTQPAPASIPPSSATAVAGIAPVGGIQFAPARANTSAPIDDDEIPF